MSNGTFMGKFSFLSTNSGTQYWLTWVTGAGLVIPAMNGTTEDATTSWIGYDAGNGFLYVVSNQGLYMYVDADLATVYLGPQSQATPLQFLPAATFGTAQNAEVEREYQGQLQAMIYTAGQQNSFWQFSNASDDADAPDASVYSTVQMTMISPDLGTLQSTKNGAGYDFSGVDFSDADLSGIDFTGANFSGAILDGTTFTGATLAGAHFENTDLSNVIWGTNINAAGAHLAGAIATGAVIASSSPGQATFSGADFTNADFSGADLTGADLSSALLYGANFANAALGGANLAGISGGIGNGALGVDFTSAYLAGANLAGAHLEGANLSCAQAYSSSGAGTFSKAFLVDTNLTGADVSGMSFDSAQIVGANFDGATMRGTFLTSVTLQPSPANLPVSMVGAHLEGASFAQSQLVQVRMTNAFVAVAAGVPLFTTTSIGSSDLGELDAATLPGDFPSIFGGFGIRLDPSATVTVVTAGSQWTLAQNPIEVTLGTELIGFTVTAANGSVSVFASTINVNELAVFDSTPIALGISYTVTATTLEASQLDSLTRLPNGMTLGANNAAGTTWQSMLTANRPQTVTPS